MIDFGLAKEVGESDRSNPEIIDDWWSVGILLYAMLAGHVSLIRTFAEFRCQCAAHLLIHI